MLVRNILALFLIIPWTACRTMTLNSELTLGKWHNLLSELMLRQCSFPYAVLFHTCVMQFYFLFSTFCFFKAILSLFLTDLQYQGSARGKYRVRFTSGLICCGKSYFHFFPECFVEVSDSSKYKAEWKIVNYFIIIFCLEAEHGLSCVQIHKEAQPLQVPIEWFNWVNKCNYLSCCTGTLQ